MEVSQKWVYICSGFEVSDDEIGKWILFGCHRIIDNTKKCCVSLTAFLRVCVCVRQSTNLTFWQRVFFRHSHTPCLRAPCGCHPERWTPNTRKAVRFFGIFVLLSFEYGYGGIASALSANRAERGACTQFIYPHSACIRFLKRNFTVVGSNQRNIVWHSIKLNCFKDAKLARILFAFTTETETERVREREREF